MPRQSKINALELQIILRQRNDAEPVDFLHSAPLLRLYAFVFEEKTPFYGLNDANRDLCLTTGEAKRVFGRILRFFVYLEIAGRYRLYSTTEKSGLVEVSKTSGRSYLPELSTAFYFL